jgi:hypothetical protein
MVVNVVGPVRSQGSVRYKSMRYDLENSRRSSSGHMEGPSGYVPTLEDQKKDLLRVATS